MGPYCDANNRVLSSQPQLSTFEEMSDKVLVEVIERLLAATKAQLVVLPSLRDLGLDSVYPQPAIETVRALSPYDDHEVRECMCCDSHSRSLRVQRVVFLPNPSMFSVNEVVFAVSSVDVLKHIASQEAR
jgi:hypothetical protein